ncbi:hypothetical protein HYC85_018932 [Camellia sinensis]|uniref:WRKY domain-containing protein n=1 Tax=Camellia sinensis TaxID=4442 RepID=A0A7J7GX59_CAMSI|nr:hypothetical protein HYC85_018932 [Camellia sinensis]
MRSFFLQTMENYQGDLADIVRASGGGVSGSGFSGEVPVSDWQFPADHSMNYPSGLEEPAVDDFGDPFFSNMRDPLLHELNMPSSGFFNSSNNSTEIIKSGVGDPTTTAAFGGGAGGVLGHKILDEQMKRPLMLQISPNSKLPVSPCESPVVAVASPRGIKASAFVPNDLISANTSKSCLVESTGVQISSPRNSGIKRRKSQAKKVVCIPAPAPANSRQSGEVVPSDLWAWRKYGQKPIKGSPYPRGYYRCSSSKGCSARKQVERSRTDPNMLVITYTSEHNHPWPTQRNALAGSTRSQPSKNNNNNNSASKNSPRIKQEQKESSDNVDTMSSSTTPVKEEMVEDLDKQIEMEDGEFSEGFSYRPALPESFQSDQDFFADLGEIEADPLNLLFSQGFSGDEVRENKEVLDQFSSLFEWNGNNGSNINNTDNLFSFWILLY